MDLRPLADGERPGPCRIGDTDELRDLCALLDDATAALPRELAEVDGCRRRAPAPEPWNGMGLPVG